VDRLLLPFGRFVFKYRDYLAPATLLVALLLTRPRPFLGDPAYDGWLDAFGILVSLAGQALRMVVIGLAYIQRGGKNKEIAADKLVCEGVFAHCRNPLYVGNFLLLTGLVIVWNSPWVYLVVLPLFGAALYSMVKAEEAFLRGKFGAQFEDYCARVNRFVPNFSGFGQTLSKFDFDWRRVVRKEYGTTFSWTTTAVVLIVVEHLEWWGVPQSSGLVARSALIWVALLLVYSTARWMKKSGRLESTD
jgi:protein-S-isoprenylcysteine O-methyltransferase Ste14